MTIMISLLKLIKIFFIIIFIKNFVSTSRSSISSSSPISCNLRQFDYCITNFYYEQYGIPNDEQQLQKSCNTINELYDCLNNYGKRCMSYALRETMLLILNSVTKQIFDICSKPSNHSDHLEIFKHSKCLNKYSIEINSCTKYTRNIIFYTIESSIIDRIPIFCCNIKILLQCLRNKTKDYCGEETAKFAQDNNNPFLYIINSICSYYQTSDIKICQDKMLPIGWKSKSDPKSTIARIINALF